MSRGVFASSPKSNRVAFRDASAVSILKNLPERNAKRIRMPSNSNAWLSRTSFAMKIGRRSAGNDTGEIFAKQPEVRTLTARRRCRSIRNSKIPDRFPNSDVIRFCAVDADSACQRLTLHIMCITICTFLSQVPRYVSDIILYIRLAFTLARAIRISKRNAFH